MDDHHATKDQHKPHVAYADAHNERSESDCGSLELCEFHCHTQLYSQLLSKDKLPLIKSSASKPLSYYPNFSSISESPPIRPPIV